MKEMRNIMAEMRDGALLACNVFRPDDDKPYPAILLRTPYIKEDIGQEDLYSNYREMAEAGYNMVFQDVRGTGASQGVLDATGANESADGYDTVEWLAAQPWCDGNIGLQGLSYFGFTQMAAAENNPPHLRALCPFQHSAIMPFSASRAGTYGCYHLAWVYDRVLQNLDNWYRDEQERERIRQEVQYFKEHWREEMLAMPLRDTPAARIKGVPQLHSFLDLIDGVEDPSFLAKAGRPVKVEDIKSPMLFLTGWFDGARDGTVDNWLRAGQGSSPPENRKLIIGPWLHGGGLSASIEGMEFGQENSGRGCDIHGLMKRWFDYWLKGVDTGVMAEPRVRFFVLGDRCWREASDWPPREAEDRSFFIHAGLGEKTGTLNGIEPENEPSQRYVYDPENPMPSMAKDSAGRQILADVSEQQERDDVLVYRSDPLEQKLTIAGTVRFLLYASTDAPDTDFVCRLSDEDETGYAFPLLTGIARCRFRNGPVPELITPGTICELEIELGNVSNAFLPGHRIRVDITSSYYPEHDINPNTAYRIGRSPHMVKANQVIYHDAAYPSHLILPVIS